GGGAPVTSGKNGGRIINVKAGQQNDLSTIFGSEPVPTVDNKFALIIGNSKSPEPGTELAFAANDAALINAALTTYAGYAAENVTVLSDVTAAQIRAAVTSMAEKIPAKATLLIYFTGQANHLGGQDYLAGNDIEFSTDSSKMIEKRAVIQPFLAKGANVFFFAQCNRPFTSTDYFGKERLQQGTLSETYATIPGSIVTSVFRETGQVGLYTDAFVKTLREFYTNQVPITEFCWNVFYAMRGGTSSNNTRGGATQTPSLPILTNLGPTSPF
ncbi:MAG: caspase family protein, partial [Fimbriimonadaceae bacterium]